ncbi:hypothetical protein ACJVC5_01290 [Peredibacter sp. HCB2-198]|uniref:hypothetical protein n=1 Tax=Peredibacter sp. HCB2-198 TaxID=3383025 RepID=UPI0038B5B38C
MKTSLTKLSSSFLLLSFSLAVYAKPVAQVTEINGTVFVVTPEGKTSALKVNQHIEEKSEVMVEEGATVTLNDYYDATYHLTGGSHLKFFNKSVQLKKGKTWIQSVNARHPLALTTANAAVDFWKGEFITTFDQASSRSQVLVVNGEVEVSNVLDKNMKYTVAAGTFSLIDPEVENGIPRTPTKVGLASLNKALSEFKQLPEKIKATEPRARSIASVEEKAPAPVKKGEIIFISTNRLPASVSGSAHKYYKQKVTTKKVVDARPVPIRIYGTSYQKTEPYVAPTEAPRQPASVQSVTPDAAKKMPQTSVLNQEFGESLKKHTAEQPKYSKELEKLIDDLKSY